MSNETESGLAQLRDVVPNMVPDDSGDTQHAEKSESGKEGGANSKKHKRVALCIGVDEYNDKQFKQLKCAFSDAQLMNSILADNGYDVDCLQNATEQEIISAITSTAMKLEANGAFVLYFAGHGCLCNQNLKYQVLLSRDSSYDDAQGATVSLHLDKISSVINNAFGDRGQCQCLVIVDACRDDIPNKRCGGAGPYKTASSTRNVQMFVLNACQKEKEARENDRHGFFTSSLCEVLKEKRKGCFGKILLNDALIKEVNDKLQEQQNSSGIKDFQQIEFEQDSSSKQDFVLFDEKETDDRRRERSVFYIKNESIPLTHSMQLTLHDTLKLYAMVISQCGIGANSIPLRIMCDKFLLLDDTNVTQKIVLEQVNDGETIKVTMNDICDIVHREINPRLGRSYKEEFAICAQEKRQYGNYLELTSELSLFHEHFKDNGCLLEDCKVLVCALSDSLQ